MIFKTLSYIAEKLNDNGVIWAVGASIVLHQYGLIDKPNDIDILIDLNDIEKADEILRSIGEKKEWEKTDAYSTKYFYEYVVNSVDVDVMSGLTINYDKVLFKYIFDQISITEFKKTNEIDIPLTSLEDWYVLYQLIPGRNIKVKMIENYLLKNGVKNRNLLERSLKGNLPKKIRENIEKILLH